LVREGISYYAFKFYILHSGCQESQVKIKLWTLEKAQVCIK